mmetsp:Transcript_34156/g.46475  ORF Transcript_34156/g.46475 Transcript_34156/m.46475 type:complete len:87 (+) Transcript_34156:58-318(+)
MPSIDCSKRLLTTPIRNLGLQEVLGFKAPPPPIGNQSHPLKRTQSAPCTYKFSTVLSALIQVQLPSATPLVQGASGQATAAFTSTT